MKKIQKFLYCIFIILYAYVISNYGMGNTYSNIRYYFFAFIIIVAIILMLLNYKKKIKRTGLLMILPVGLFFLYFSIKRAKQVDMQIPFRTFVQIGLFVLPVLYVFTTFNILEKKDVIFLMKFTTIVIVIVYFFDLQEPKHNLTQFFNLNNYSSINYLNSESFTESSNWSEVFLQLFIFFRFTVMEDKENKKLKKYEILNFLFTILCFKRLTILFSIVILFTNKIIEKVKIKKYTSLAATIFFTGITVLYLSFMVGNIVDVETVYKLTSGRNYILSLWERSNYLSYGYGSSMLIIERYLEMDLVQIYMELNIFCLFIFCLFFFKICKKSSSSYLLMIYTFFNLLTASNLPNILATTLLITTIVFVDEFLNKNEKEEKYERINKCSNTNI